jgi:hypothetical protein
VLVGAEASPRNAPTFGDTSHYPGFGGVALLDSGGHRCGFVVRIASAEWRRRRLWKTSMYSKIAFASSTLVCQRRVLSSSTCIRDQNASITALSKQSPTDLIDGTSPDWRARSVNDQEVNCVP